MLSKINQSAPQGVNQHLQERKYTGYRSCVALLDGIKQIVSDW